MMTNELEQACSICSKPTTHTCDGCTKPHDNGCLFKSGIMLTLPSDPRNEDYDTQPTWNREEELCLSCYKDRLGKAPHTLWQGSSVESRLYPGGVLSGTSTPAGDGYHAWYQAPKPDTTITVKMSDMDAFRAVQLLEWLKANEATLKAQAAAASAILLPHERHMTDRARRADLGISDHEYD